MESIKRVILYARVSTDEQAEHGYSLEGQQRDLLAEGEREGWRVVEEIVDDGYSGADPYRPGLRRVMELAETGVIDAVVAAKRDRLFRSRYYRLAFERDLAEFGVTLVALNDTGHRIGDGVLDDFAEWEREEIANRLHNGIKNMIVKGEIKAGPKPPYGFRLDGKSLIVFDLEMDNVRTIYDRAANNESLEKIRRRLDEKGIPSPGRSASGWNKKSVRDILVNDLYKPHTFEEVASLVGESVSAELDPESFYGLWTFNRRKTTKRREWSEDKNKYVNRYKSVQNPRGEWLFVPVPDAGIPREVVEAARENLTGKGWRTATGARGGVQSRTWELRGMIRCSECGSVLSSFRATGGQIYYACRRRYNNSRKDCSNRRYFPARDVEGTVLDAMRRNLDKRSYFLERFDAHAEAERRRLRMQFAPGNIESWTEELRRMEQRRSGYIDLGADGIMDRTELKMKLEETDAEIVRLRDHLQSVRTQARDAEALEADLARTREMIESADKDWLNGKATGTDRAEMYRKLKLQAVIDASGQIKLSGVFGERVFCLPEPTGFNVSQPTNAPSCSASASTRRLPTCGRSPRRSFR